MPATVPAKTAPEGTLACGTEEDWPLLNDRGVAVCDRPAGHDGEHADYSAGVWWQPDVNHSHRSGVTQP